MENDRVWVAEKMAYLDPPLSWGLDAHKELRRFHQDIEMAPRIAIWKQWRAWAAAAALIVIGFLTLPAGRAIALEVWQFFTVRRVAFIRVNAWPAGVRSPQVGLLNEPLPPIPARDLADVRWRVHYDARLPRPGVFSTSPKLATMFSLSAGTVVNVADLQNALQRAGITDVNVPLQWDGAQIALHTSGVVIAEWPGVILAQSLPLTLATPSGFDFAAYSTIILRILGVAPDEAQRLAQRAGIAPPWLAPIDRNLHSSATIEEIQLNNGPATLLEETTPTGALNRLNLTWSVSDRVYLISGNLSRELAIAAANAVE